MTLAPLPFKAWVARSIPPARRVPLARRNLFADPRRVLLSTGGVAVALLLVLVLAGIFAGAMRQLTAYVDGSGADLIVSQRGVRTMHMSTTVLRPDIAERVLDVRGVAWAEPIGYTTGMVATPSGRLTTYVFGVDPAARHGGPSALVAGRPPGRGELVLDDQAARELEVGRGRPGPSAERVVHDRGPVQRWDQHRQHHRVRARGRLRPAAPGPPSAMSWSVPVPAPTLGCCVPGWRPFRPAPPPRPATSSPTPSGASSPT
jgi:hypothetical protein